MNTKNTRQSLICLLIMFFFCMGGQLEAQDTIVVQTLTLEDNFRSGVYTFPDDANQTYEKILMRYQMRCHDTAVGSGSVGCREWDYSCNTFITDSTRVDSNRATHPNYIITNFSGDLFDYTNQATYTYQQYQQYQVDYTDVISEQIAEIGTGTEQIQLGGSQSVARAQFIYTADELLAGGFLAGAITGLRMDVTELGDEIDFMRIKMKHTSKTELEGSDPDLDDFTEVYFLSTAFSNIGEQAFNFYNNFDWDGSSNVLIEFSYTGEATTSPLSISGHETGYNVGILAAQADHALTFNGAGNIPLDISPFTSVSDEISLAFWTRGDSDALPANTYIFEAVNGNNTRVLGSHLPWSNGQIYWDCGNDGAGYDRINLPADALDYGGQWNHWVFTKNATTGQMKIYLNGTLWHSGSAKNKTMEGVTAMRIGSSASGATGYLGAIDNVQIWNAELDETTIQDWMRKPLDASHPYATSLLYDYNLNEGIGFELADASTNNLDANISGGFVWNQIRGKDLFKGFSETTVRPNLSLIQGTYEINETTIIVLDSTLNAQNQVLVYDVNGTDLIVVDTFFAYPANETYVYDEAGNIVDTIQITPEASLTIENLTYYSKFPAKYEILSLVTPYGNGLDLGPNGKTFTFDLTDYAPILKGDRRLSIEMGGQNQEELNIQFLFITGTPPREVLDIQNIWPFRRGYFGSILDDVVFEPRMVPISNDGDQFKIRSSITGHGQNGEFVEREHYFNINAGTNEFEFPVWKKCGAIPIYPQGGTWLFDRAGWCPGDPTTVHHFDITPYVSAGQSAEIDYGLLGGLMDAANYLISNQLVTYGAPNFTNDAAVVDILRPSKKVENERFNPACNQPIAVIQNTGANPLVSLEINYQVQGGEMLTYNWSGNLALMETEEVVLPVDNVSFWLSSNPNPAFEVSVSQPNGSADEYAQNNSILSDFDMAVIYEGEVKIVYNTNNRASENEMYIKDHAGNIVLERTNMDNNTNYEDFLNLPPGCYTMEFNDSGEDGLYYWYWEALGLNVGSGSVRYEKLLGANIWLTQKVFEPEFGSHLKFDFVLAEVVDVAEAELYPTIINVRPNPASTKLTVDLIGFEGRDMIIDLFDNMGRRLLYQTVDANALHQLQIDFDISKFPSGMYTVRIDDGAKIKYKKVVKE